MIGTGMPSTRWHHNILSLLPINWFSRLLFVSCYFILHKYDIGMQHTFTKNWKIDINFFWFFFLYSFPCIAPSVYPTINLFGCHLNYIVCMLHILKPTTAQFMLHEVWIFQFCISQPLQIFEYADHHTRMWHELLCLWLAVVHPKQNALYIW